jgi:hypothetical protein
VAAAYHRAPAAGPGALACSVADHSAAGVGRVPPAAYRFVELRVLPLSGPAAYAYAMTKAERSERLAALAADARAAETRGDGWDAGDAWRRYELVRDGGRDPDELLAEGIALSRIALDLAEQTGHHAG